MIIDTLQAISTPIQSTDELAIERGTTTYKIAVSNMAASTSAPGLMSAADKTKLNGLVVATLAEAKAYLGIT